MTPYASLLRAIGCCAALVLILPLHAGAAQSLGDIAKAEAERRKSAPSAGKVYTGDTLRPDPSSRPAPPPVAIAPAAANPPASAGVQPDTSKPQTVEPTAPPDEKAWRARMQGERDALQRAEMFAEALQSRINALSTDFTARDDPAQRTQVAADREKALAELARVQQEIKQHTKNITTIEEEARRAGIPAGWVR
jgi:hypothetical protein